MARPYRQLCEIVEEILSDYPGMTYRLEHRKHIHVVLMMGNKSRYAVYPKSASDHRAILNGKAIIRKIAREISNDR